MNDLPCTAQPITACEDCTLTTRLMCRYEKRDTTHFFMIFLPQEIVKAYLAQNPLMGDAWKRNPNEYNQKC